MPFRYRDPITRSWSAVAATRSGRYFGSCEKSASIWQTRSTSLCDRAGEALDVRPPEAALARSGARRRRGRGTRAPARRRSRPVPSGELSSTTMHAIAVVARGSGGPAGRGSRARCKSGSTTRMRGVVIVVLRARRRRPRRRHRRGGADDQDGIDHRDAETLLREEHETHEDRRRGQQPAGRRLAAPSPRGARRRRPRTAAAARYGSHRRDHVPRASAA